MNGTRRNPAPYLKSDPDRVLKPEPPDRHKEKRKGYLTSGSGYFQTDGPQYLRKSIWVSAQIKVKNEPSAGL